MNQVNASDRSIGRVPCAWIIPDRIAVKLVEIVELS